MKKSITLFATASIMACSVKAVTLANPSFDTDSYLNFGTNNAFNPQITIGESQRPGSGHFNFGVIEFDVTSIATGGNKYLSLSAVEYVTLTPNPMGPPTTTISDTGSATVQLVALGDSFSNYQAAADKIAWYDANVQSSAVSVLGVFNFSNQSTLTVDVTSTVNGWIGDAATNNGFALFSTAGNVELASSTYTDDPSLCPALLDTPVSTPEPASVTLLGLGGIAFILRRKR